MRFLAFFIFTIGVYGSASVYADECTIFVHGLGRTSNSLSFISREVNKLGHLVVNKTYPSRHYTIEKLSLDHLPKWVELCKGLDKINFVTHSMGGIMVRYYLEKINKPENLGKVVMMAPPNHGSELVDKYGGFSSLVLGPANHQLGTSPKSLPNKLGPADYTLGIIAGTKTANPLSYLIFDQPNDGKVTVESSKLEGMADHIVLPYTHTFMMERREVAESVISFLNKAAFK